MSNTSYGREDMSIWARKALDYAVRRTEQQLTSSI